MSTLTVVGPEIPTLEFQSENSPEQSDLWEKMLDATLRSFIQGCQGERLRAELLVQADPGSVWQQAHTLQETLKRQRAFGQKHLREKRKLAERRKAYDWVNQRTQF